MFNFCCFSFSFIMGLANCLLLLGSNSLSTVDNYLIDEEPLFEVLSLEDCKYLSEMADTVENEDLQQETSSSEIISKHRKQSFLTLATQASFGGSNVLNSVAQLSLTPFAISPCGEQYFGTSSALALPLVAPFKVNLNSITIVNPKKGVYSVGYFITLASGTLNESPLNTVNFFGTVTGNIKGFSQVIAIPFQTISYNTFNTNSVRILGTFNFSP